MAQFVFEGDLNGIRTPQLDFISAVLEKRGFKETTVSIENVGNIGDNYLANVKRIVIEQNGETFKMVGKFAPENMRRGPMFDIFGNEEFAYSAIFPKFEEKWSAAGISEDNRIRFPKFYGASTVAPNEVILLEDLKESGYHSVSRFDSISDEGITLMLKFLATYHSMSFVIRHQEPETFASFQKKLEYMHHLDPQMLEAAKPHFEGVEKQALSVVEEKYMNIIKGAITNTGLYDKKISNMVKDSNHTIIQHGDAWITNVMFLSEDGVPRKCLMVDYQLIKENSPVFDLMFMIFNSTTHEQRSTKFHNYIDIYHKELDESLNNFGLKANLVYPRDRLDADMKIYGKLAFSHNVMFASVSTRNPEEAAKMKECMELEEMPDPDKLEEMMTVKNEKSLALFKAKVEDLIESYCQYGLI